MSFGSPSGVTRVSVHQPIQGALRIIGRAESIRNTRAAGRLKDRAGIEAIDG